MAVIDPNRTWALLDERLATTTNERHRQMLDIVRVHMKAEAEGDLETLMSTLAPNPQYHFWSQGRDIGPKTTEGVRQYYSEFVGSKSNVLEYALERLVLDDDTLVTEGNLKIIYPGAAAKAVGFPVDDENGDYLVEMRQLLLWPIDENGLILGEDSYSDIPHAITKLTREDLPQQYIDLVYAETP